MRSIILTAGVLFFAACSSESRDTASKTVDAAVQSPSAVLYAANSPVLIETTYLTDTEATLRLTFRSRATDVALEVYGLDGLVVTSATPIAGTAFAAEETTEVRVFFKPGPGQSRLAAFVGGKFNGQPRGHVRSFDVGAESVGQQQAHTEAVEVDADGRRIHIMPAKRN